MHPSHRLFLKKLKNFENSFNKVPIPRRIQQIHSCYYALKLFCRETSASCQITYESDSVSIRIVSQNLLVFDELPKVQWLLAKLSIEAEMLCIPWIMPGPSNSWMVSRSVVPSAAV